MKLSSLFRFGFPDLAFIVTCACWGLNFVITFPAASLLLFLTALLMGERLGVQRRYLAGIAVTMISSDVPIL